MSQTKGMFRTLLPLNSLELTKLGSGTGTNTRSVSPTGLCNNRTLAPKTGFGQEKKLAMHFIASLEHELKIPDAPEPLTTLETKST